LKILLLIKYLLYKDSVFTIKQARKTRVKVFFFIKIEKNKENIWKIKINLLPLHRN